ncbi:MAG: nucleoside deaminase [Limnobacter sp.]|nr:nucleoside deaminase [Limnobacter sp.]
MLETPKFPVLAWAENSTDRHMMQLALEQAERAGKRQEVPIGAVLVHEGRVLAQAGNAPIHSTDPTGHAEINAIRQACAQLNNYRLSGACLYVTLEPCIMCLGAILHARVGRVVTGAHDSRFNQSLKHTVSLVAHSPAWHACQFETGCMAEESKKLLTDFFAHKRTQQKAYRQSATPPNKQEPV